MEPSRKLRESAPEDRAARNRKIRKLAGQGCAPRALAIRFRMDVSTVCKILREKEV